MKNHDDFTDQQKSGRFVQKHDLTGQRFHKFVAQKIAGRGNWLCQCDCGSTRVKSAFDLMAGRAKSCGCLRSEVKAQRADRFGCVLTQDTLKSVLHYESLTGVFTWLEALARRIKVGSTAGKENSHGYITIKVGPRRYPAHHLAWLYMHGSLPADQIDHMNLIRHDNRIENLRECDYFLNRQNTSLHRNNTSGFKGVSRRRGIWVAEIMVNLKTTHLGSFPTPESASEVYLSAKRRLHPFFIEGQGVQR
ncbi:MAG: HNH endonuclease [Polaromonas sp.]|nr:HNH endonuclease [Polaromonas sp.]